MSALQDNAAAVLEHMRRRDSAWRSRDLAKKMGVSASNMQVAISYLVKVGAVKVVAQPSGWLYSLPLVEVAPADDLVTPFRVNRYTAPLNGYSARLSAAADLAMAGRA